MASLFEGDADPPLLAPHHPAGPVASVRWDENRVKCAGMPTGLVTSRAAPMADRFLMVQSIAPPPNSLVAAFRTRWRPVLRFSPMAGGIYTRIPNGKIGFDDLSSLPARIAAQE
jgi:hypothetical protein